MQTNREKFNESMRTDASFREFVKGFREKLKAKEEQDEIRKADNLHADHVGNIENLERI